MKRREQVQRNFCPQCGNRIDAEWGCCPYCGNEFLRKIKRAKRKKNMDYPYTFLTSIPVSIRNMAVTILNLIMIVWGIYISWIFIRNIIHVIKIEENIGILGRIVGFIAVVAYKLIPFNIFCTLNEVLNIRTGALKPQTEKIFAGCFITECILISIVCLILGSPSIYIKFLVSVGELDILTYLKEIWFAIVLGGFCWVLENYRNKLVLEPQENAESSIKILFPSLSGYLDMFGK